MANDEQAIRNLIETWCRETESGNVDGILPLMSDDMVFLVPNHPPFGKEHFAQHFRGMQGKVRIGVQSEIEEIQVAGDFAWCRQHLTVTVTPLGGGDTTTTTMTGYSLGIYRCEGGRWLLIRDANLVA